MEQWMAVARANDLDTRMLTAAEAAEMVPGAVGEWKGGMFTCSDARAEPFTAVKTIAQGLQSRGGLVREACAVRTVERQAGTVSAAVTEHGTVRTQAVVCAAGAWSNMFLGNLDIDLPQLCVRATIARTEPVESIFDGNAMLEDFFLRRRRDGGYTVTTEMTEHIIGANSFRYLFPFQPSRKVTTTIKLTLGRDPTQAGFPRRSWSGDDVSPFERTRVLDPKPSPKVKRLIRQHMARRVPAFANVRLAQTWGGMIDATPDIVPVMDRVNGLDGLFIATGFSGHGFGIGPGAGQVMARLVTGEDPGYDLRRFRFSRFSDGSKVRPGPAI
jgi:glycine/D-amino acid oxidase-like deaminating enzyme